MLRTRHHRGIMGRSTGRVAPWRDFVSDTTRRDLTLGEIAGECIASRRMRGRASRELESRLRPSRHPRDPGGAVWSAWHDMPLREIGPIEVAAWVAALRAAGRAPNTVRTLVTMLSVVMEYAVRTGAADHNPCRSLPRDTLPPKQVVDPDKARLEVLTLEDARRVVGAHELKHWAPWCGLLLTGLRWGELVALRWRHVSRHVQPLGEIAVVETYDCRTRETRPTKARIPRRVPVHPAFRRCLEWSRGWYRFRLRREPGASDLLFPFGVEGGRPKHWHANTAIKYFRRDLQALGIADPAAGPRRLHATRHTFASHLYRAGAQWRLIESMTHHSGRQTAEGSALPTYAHASWDDTCAAILRLPYGEGIGTARAV